MPIKQCELHPCRIPDDAVMDKVFTPDFGSVSLLYKEFGINNDIDLAIQKPQYRDIINSRLTEIPQNPSPNLDDATLLENVVSREFDANELREIAINESKNFNKK